ncbi:collagen-like protein [Gramella sp. GC03-9]|uniref:Collagen-like protein n=1 Tax=Christiangramia oceanisediminis TaxID=2920386 RepID=A0A9X2KYS8_9FLAO|nr:collagen-like protein [Gramella oceanisediminis]MCP9200742.1 collagen-like protein [Gramella oceanisediminis]
MKKLLSLFAVFSLFLVACEGDQGPPGPPGQDGVNVVGQTFEITFDFDENYSEFVSIPESVEVLDSDVILVYLLEDVVDGSDVWSLLPQTFYLEDGEVQYNYNHTSFDVNIYLHGTVDLNSLGSAFTDNQTFRMVVVPSDFALDSNIDVNSYQAVKAALNLDEKKIVKAQLNK